MPIQKYLILFFLDLITFGCNSNDKTEKNVFVQTSNGLQYNVLKGGQGKPVKSSQEVLIHENMYYINDSLLFDSRSLSHPIKIEIGGGQDIDGVDEALVGMKLGEIKQLIVPTHLSKRTAKHNFPHPDSTLLYTIEIVDLIN